MGYKNLNLLESVVTTYDQTKTTVFGRVSERTVFGSPSLGPSVPHFADVLVESSVIPSGVTFLSTVETGDIVRVFAMGTPIAGSVALILYNNNIKLGTLTYVGKLIISSPDITTTTSFRGLEILDTGTTGWKVFFSYTNAVLINGGISLLNKIDLADFTPLGAVSIAPATGDDQKAKYFLQDPANIGVGQLNIASVGMLLDQANNKAYVHNGTAATHQYYVYDTSIAPTFTESAITGTNAAPGVFTLTAHGFLNSDPILFKTTGSYTGLITNTVYFARNITSDTFEMSTTSVGASISTVGSQAGVHVIGRAFGTTGSNFVTKTGNLTPLVGVLLANNGENYANPQHVSYGALVGNGCAAFGTTTNLYMGKLSDLTSAATSWTSLTTSNVLGSLNEVTLPTVAFCQFSNTLDLFVIISNISFTNYAATLYYGKRLVNNEYQFKGGRTNNSYYEAMSNTFGSVRFGLTTVSGFNIGDGIAIMVGTTIGQRGFVSLDMSIDERVGRDSVITKVMDTPNSILKAVSVIDKLGAFTDTYSIYYRTSGFGSATGGWVLYDKTELSSLVIPTQIQLKITWNILKVTSQTASQISDIVIVTESNDDISDNWEYSHDSSSSLSPTRVAFRLKFAYGSSIPSTLRFRSYDLDGNLLLNQTITSNPANFQYSDDEGATWLSLGTIPNVVGTLVRYTFTSPPGVDIRPALRDS